MLTRIIPIFIAVCLICGCGSRAEKKSAAIKIDNINITANEYAEAFKNSPYASSDTPEARKEFLNNFITRMLIFREAERIGMDKNPEFLNSIQFFWQQSLLKLMLDRKIKELSLYIRVDDREIKDYYQANAAVEFSGRDLPAVYDEIKWIVLNKKQKTLMDDWINSLRSASKIDVNYRLLKIEK